MRSKARFAILAIGAIVLAASVGIHAQEGTSKAAMPHGWVTEHETLKYGDKVLYDKDVLLDDPNSIALNVHLMVDEVEKSELSVLGSVSVDKDAREDVRGNLIQGYMITYVVHDLTKDSHAMVTLVYTLRDSEEKPGKSGFVVFPVKLGETRAVMGKNGTKVVINVAKQTD